MKKHLVFLLFAMLILGVSATSSEAKPEFTLEFGHIQNPGHALAIAPEEFKAMVEERTGGRVKVNLYPSSQLGVGLPYICDREQRGEVYKTQYM